MRFLQRGGDLITQSLEQPLLVLITCLALMAASLLFDQSLLSLWRLHRQSHELSLKSAELEKQLSLFETSIAQAKDPHFIERIARERFDLVSKGDLVFVFEDSED